MTVAVLRGVGVAVDDSRPNHWIVSPGPIRAFDQRIEQDLSNAGPFLAAALATRGTVRIPNWPAATTQVGDLWRSILTTMGATVTLDGRHPDRHRRPRDQGRATSTRPANSPPPSPRCAPWPPAPHG